MGKPKKVKKEKDSPKKSRKQLLKERQELKLKLKLEEEEKERQEKLEKERLKNLAKLAQEKERIALLEHEIRNDILYKSCERFRQIREEKLAREIAVREEESWQRYIKCDGKPDPSDMRAMNYYLYAWKTDPNSDNIENLLIKTDEIFDVLDLQEEYITIPLNEFNYTINLWRDMRQRVLKDVFLKIDKATYNVMHDVQKYMTTIDKLSAKLIIQKPYLDIGMWAKCQLPGECPSDSGAPPYFPVAELPEVYITVQVPYQLAYQFYVIRVNRLKNDFYSDLSRTAHPKLLPDEFLRNLYEYNKDEFEAKEKLKREYEARLVNEQKKRQIRKSQDISSKERKGSKLEGDADSVQSDNVPADSSLAETSINVETADSTASDLLPEDSISSLQSWQQDDSKSLKLPSETILQMEEANIQSLKVYYEVTFDSAPDELNLRQYVILGGVYHIDFLEAIPQPVTLRDRSVLCLTYEKSELKYIEFDWKKNFIQRKSVSRLREYFDELSKSMELGGIDQKVEDFFTGGERRQSKYYIPGEQRSSMLKSKITEKQPKKSKKSTEKRESEDQSTNNSELDGEEAPIKQEEEEQDDSYHDVDLDEESSCEDDEKSREPLEFDELTDDIEDDGQNEDAFDEKRRYDEEISILEFDEIHFKPEIFITLNKECLWFSNPLLVTWDSENQYWSTSKGMQDIKYDEQKQVVSFRMEAHRTPFALAMPRYLIFPLTSWEMKPVYEEDSSEVKRVMYSIHAHRLSIVLTIMAGKVCVSSLELQNRSSTNLEEDKKVIAPTIGVYDKPHKIIQMLERIGLDIFPDYDAYLYINDVMPKHPICEDHLYMCMSLACTTHAFMSSRWNKIADHKKIYMNYKEQYKQDFKLEPKLTLITPERAVLMNNDESSYELTDQLPEESTYYPDLYWLIEGTSSTLTKLNMKKVDMAIVDTVYTMLCRSRIFSYC